MQRRFEMHTIRHAIIACHPSEDSFTLSVARRYAEAVEAHGQRAIIRDLYRMNFDPVLREQARLGHPEADVLREWDELAETDVFVLVYPIWYGSPPALLKGYIDRVFGAGRTRGLAENAEAGRLSGKRLVSFTSSGSMRAWLEEKGIVMSLRNLFDRYLGHVFGFSATQGYHFDGVTADIPERDVRMHLADVEKAAREVMSQIIMAQRA
jgi:NAD(P)H dehydrogenase (quinone)